MEEPDSYIEIPEPGEALTLACDRGRINVQGTTTDCSVKAVLTASPRPRVEFEVESPESILHSLDEAELTFCSSKTVVRAQIFGSTCSERGCVVKLLPLQDPSPKLSLDAPVSRIVFSLPNFPEFFVQVQDPLSAQRARQEEIRLSCSHWKVTIRNMAAARRRAEVLKATGGFGITAIGVLERSDAMPFNWSDAESELEALRFFLSFACGRWTGPMLPAGLDEAGERVWLRWHVPLVDDGVSVHTWFDTHHGELLANLYPGFIEKWNDPVWNQAFSYAIYWFVRSNLASAGTDGSLILSQAALEILSWTYLVKGPGAISKSEFGALKTAGKIRELLTKLSIPTDVPGSLLRIQKASCTRGWTDSASVIASIRNDLIHPKKTGPIGPVTEAWILAQRLIELVLLRLCNFNGDHANRTNLNRWLGQVEPVPWA